MKPIKLEMTAFGSYAEYTCIDFRKFNSGLYLITGDTGAGKTTIFDAIMIALFGEASGKAAGAKNNDNNRSFEKLHSDHVEKKVDTVVKLLFLQNGQEYTVTRTLHFSKTQGTVNEYNKSTISAVLEEPNKDPITGSVKVNNRIQTIIGMDGEKFRKVIMLAQGEFKKFLQASSDEKGKILGELFDSSAYLYYQNLLEGAKDKLEKIRRDYVEEINHALRAFDNPDPDNEDYLAGSADLVSALESLVEKDQAELERIDASLKDLEELYKNLLINAEIAKNNNINLKDLDDARKEAVELEGKAPVIECLKTRIERVKDADDFVLPKEKDEKKCLEELEALKSTISNQTVQMEKQTIKVQEAEKVCEEDEPAKEEIEKLSGSIKVLAESLGDYKTLSAANREAKRASAAVKDKQESLEVLKNRLDELKSQIEEYTRRSEEYKSAEKELSEAKQVLKEAQKNLETFEKPETGILAQHKKIRKMEKQLKDLLEDADKYNTLQQQAFSHYVHLNTLYMEGQAGILAEKLGKDIEEQGQEYCPVCGTLIKKEDISRLARKPERTPSEDQVKAANDDYLDVAEKYTDKNGKVSAAQAKMEEAQEQLLQKLRDKYPECDSWEKIKDGEYLNKLADDCRQLFVLAGNAVKTADTRNKTANSLVTKLNQVRNDYETRQGEIEPLNEAIGTESRNLARAKATIEALRPKLLYDNQKAAEEEKKELENKKKSLEALVADHVKVLNREKEKLSSIQGSLNENKSQLPARKTALETAKAELLTSLKTHHFTDLEEVHQLIAEAEAEGLSVKLWIRKNEKEVNDYKIKCNLNEEIIRDLEKKTKDISPVDLEELSRQITEVNDKKENLNDVKTDFILKADNHKKTKNRVADAKKKLAGTDSAWKRIDRLGALAAATENEVGGKLSFERYVMGSMFAEIIEMANMRLNLMTGGKYELVNKTTGGRASAKTGFLINVLDRETDKERPSETLSGGESFLASLALALGLSDVVQNHEGGVEIDSLFIDEGFGTLDDGVLDKAVEVLRQLTEGDRLVGIISHVSKLESSITDKIVVKKSEKGSKVEVRI